MEAQPLPAARILVVEDDQTLRDTLQYNLVRAGFEVVTAEDGVAGLHLARLVRPDLIILDLMLPRLDGISVCRILANESAVPIVILTAMRDEQQRISGLEQGAIDYVVKPFRMAELLARLRAILRWGERQRNVTGIERIQVGPIMIDRSSRQVYCDQRLITLSQREFELLDYLVAHAGVALSRDALLNDVWGPAFIGSNRTIDVHIRWLREKIEADPSNPRLIRTVRGLGYCFATPESL